MMTVTLTERDLDFLETLTCRVSMFTLRQIAGVWWPNERNPNRVRRRLSRLAKAGWINRHVVNARAPLWPLCPLFGWRPGGEAPDANHIASAIRSRLLQAPRPTEIFVASPLAANLHGSIAPRLSPHRRDHQLRLAAVYVHYRTKLPDLDGLWSNQDSRPSTADETSEFNALLTDKDGRPLRAIQVAGRWAAVRILDFHDHCASAGLPYELW